MLRVIILLFAPLALLGCDPERHPSDFICLNAENRFIDGKEGFRPVALYEYAEETIIGYSHHGELVPHSECAPAKTTKAGTFTRFEWFYYGEQVEVEGVSSLTFEYKNGTEQLKATRLVRQGGASVEYAELKTDKPRITKRVWEQEAFGVSVEAEQNFEGKNRTQAIATKNTTEKQLIWNDNTQQWDCYYSNPISSELSLGCANESTLDEDYFGFPLPLLPYIESLSDSIHYPIDKEDLLKELDVYPTTSKVPIGSNTALWIWLLSVLIAVTGVLAIYIYAGRLNKK